MFRYSIGDGLELRLAEERQAEQIYALADRNRDYLRRWLPWVDGLQSPHDTRRFIQDGLFQLANHNGFQASIWLEGDVTGMIGFHFFNWPNRKTEIGYWLGAEYQGRGIMTRACRAMVDHAVKELGLHRVEIRCATGNMRSCAIPERLGFTREGVLRQAEWIYGVPVDSVVYSVLAPEWSA